MALILTHRPLCSVPREEPGCQVTYVNQTILDGRCRSTGPALIGQCSGTCESSVRMVNAANHADCFCCQILQTTEFDVDMECMDPSGGYVAGEKKTILSISQCGCLDCDVEDIK